MPSGVTIEANNLKVIGSMVALPVAIYVMNTQKIEAALAAISASRAVY